MNLIRELEMTGSKGPLNSEQLASHTGTSSQHALMAAAFPQHLLYLIKKKDYYP